MRPLDGESATQFLLMGQRHLRLTGMVKYNGLAYVLMVPKILCSLWSVSVLIIINPVIGILWVAGIQVEDDLMSVSVDHLRVCDTCSLFYYLLSRSFLFDHDNGYPLSIRAFTGTCVCLAFGDVTMQCFEYQKSATQLYCL
jgi:hypothetical protein